MISGESGEPGDSAVRQTERRYGTVQRHGLQELEKGFLVYRKVFILAETTILWLYLRL